MDHTVPQIDVHQLETHLADGAPLVDVREPHEFVGAHISGASLIPLDTVPDRVHELPADRTVYLVCAMGARSLRAAEFLRARGVDAVNVAGGTKSWIEAGKPVERE